MRGASGEPGSDVDLNISGPDAGERAAQAMTYLDATRPGWRKRFRMDILVDAGRSQTLADALGTLPPDVRQAITHRQARATEAFLLAREARNAETQEAKDAILARIPDDPANPGLKEQVTRLANLDASAAAAQQSRALVDSDRALAAIDPKASAENRAGQIRDAMDAQMLANVLDPEAYISTGAIRSVVLGKSVDVTGRYEAVIEQVDMLHHQAHEAGSMRAALRKYETFKYVMRICDQLTAAGVKDRRINFLRNQGELVYKADRGAVASDQPRDVTPGGVGGKSNVVYQDAGEVPGVTDEFLAETHEMLQGLLDEHLGELRQQALGEKPTPGAKPLMPVTLPELGPPEPARIDPQSSGPGPGPGAAPGQRSFWETGLADPDAIVRIADAFAARRLPAGATVEAHAKAALAPIADELAAIGTKPPKLMVQDLGRPISWGYFDASLNVIVVNETAKMDDGRLAFDLSDPAGVQRLRSLVLHESRHAEQYYRAMQYIQFANPAATPVMGIHPDIVDAAIAHPLARGAPEIESGGRAYDEFFGPRNPLMNYGQDFERQQNLRDWIGQARADGDLARVELQKVRWSRIRTQKLEQRLLDLQTRVTAMQVELRTREEAYRALEHEQDAYALQARLEQEMPAARLRDADRQVEETLDVLFHIREVMPDAETDALESAGEAMRIYWEALREVARLAQPVPGAPAATPAPTGRKTP